MSEKHKKDIKKISELNDVRQQVLAMIKAEPGKPIIHFGRKCVKLGLLTNPNSIYAVVRNSNYMKGELQHIRSMNAEKLSRDIVPLALAETEAALRDKKYNRDKKFKFVKLAVDKEFGQDENRRPIYPSMMSIQTLTIIRNNALNTCQARSQFLEESPDDTSPEAFLAWQKKNLTDSGVIDVTPELEGGQEKDAE